jgi:7-cyano-7-deazaguanine synthase
MAARLFARRRSPARRPLVALSFDMRDVFPPTTGPCAASRRPSTRPTKTSTRRRNVILLSKAAVYCAPPRRTSRLLLGTLAGNPFPDATPEFFAAMSRALSLGLDAAIVVEAPFATWHKADVIKRGIELGVPLELTLSCMQPRDGLHCGKCSKCRERRDAFNEAGVPDPTSYREPPIR